MESCQQCNDQKTTSKDDRERRKEKKFTRNLTPEKKEYVIVGDNHRNKGKKHLP